MSELNVPTELNVPVFLLNLPLSVSNKEPNNPWMLPDEQGSYDKPKAASQWLKLYRALTEQSLIYVLPGHGNFQDLPFVANIGAYLPHISERHVVVLSKFTSEPRRGEEVVGQRFFNSFDYEVHNCPHFWEGEADLKWVRNNLYIGGVGSRSSHVAYDWMHKRFGMEITEIVMINPKLYHLDCVIFPLNEEKLLVNIGAVRKQDLRALEKLAEVIPVPVEYVHAGWTNCVRLGHIILHAPSKGAKVDSFSKLLEKHQFDLKTFDLTEFEKSGADLSCLVFHLNYRNRF
jgi:N-dimethylarginine dimethylaminohydrolase